MDSALSANRTRRSLHIALHAASGLILALAGLISLSAPDLPSAWSPAAWIILGLGLALLLAGALNPGSRAAALSRQLSLMIITLTLMLASLEGAGRLVQVDFGRQEAAQNRLPPFFRAPRHPVPPVFYRRAGPETWTGPVLKTGVALSGTDNSAFHNEPDITVAYDKLGFRTEHPLTDWEIAIAGDSFVELGFLPHHQLFTTRIAELTQQPVRNLGVSHTGPMTHLQYLQLYGLAPHIRTVAIVFFEGNDLIDLGHEDKALQDYKATGKREFRNITKQTSFLRAVAGALYRVTQGASPQPPRINASLTTPAGDVPLTLTTRLEPSLGLSPPMNMAVETFLDQYAEFAQTNNVAPFLIYMPCKTRCLSGRFRWHAPSERESVGVLPLTLPRIMQAQCQKRGISFLDLTATLHFDTTGELLFNPVIDSHINAQGSEAVGQFLAKHLSPPVERPGQPAP